MATKKTPAPKMAQSPKTPSIHARIDRINNYEGSNIRAFASVNIGGAFAIHGVKIVDSPQKGLLSAAKNLDFMRVCESVVMNIGTSGKLPRPSRALHVCGVRYFFARVFHQLFCQLNPG